MVTFYLFLLSFIPAWALMLLWGNLAETFGFRTIDYGSALAIIILGLAVKVLFGLRIKVQVT